MKFRPKLSILVAFSILFSTQYAFPVDEDCHQYLVPSEDIQNTGKVVIDDVAILNEEHSLTELILADPMKNLIHEHPAEAMNSYQLGAALVRHAGSEMITDPEYGSGQIWIHHLFSGGLPELKGRSITAQFEAIQDFVNHLFAAARGDSSADKILLYTGPSGTGKSLLLELLADYAKFLSMVVPDFFMYRYEFTNLQKITELRAFLNLEQYGDSEFQHPLRCPINESPLNLLPRSLADVAVKMAKERAVKLANANPTPAYNRCPQCENVRGVLLRKYMRENKLATLTPQQEVEAISPYVTIKRFILGVDGGMSKIDAEPKDVDYQGLLVTPNALVLNTFGPDHPFSYFYSGKILQANRGFFLIDEMFRSDDGLRNTLLNVTEQRKVRRGGAKAIGLDFVTIAASNYESINKAKASGGADAQLDRTRRSRMPRLIHPVFAARNMLAMKGMGGILSQELGSKFDPVGGDGNGPRLLSATQSDQGLEAEASMGPADINLLFPLSRNGQPAIGPDHRYKIWVDVGPSTKPVHLSPHTLMYMAMTAAGSRLVTDIKKAAEFGPKSVLNDAAFRDEYTRLLVSLGRYNLNASDRADLKSLSRDLKEGDGGMSERDAANVWLTQAINEAQRPENDNCLTPDLARKVLLRLLEDNSIQYPDIGTRKRWEALSDKILKEYVVRELQQDVNTALGSGLGAVQSMYEEVFMELAEVAKDRTATEYDAGNGEVRPINRTRLNEIMEIYQKTNLKVLNPIEVLAVRAGRSRKSEDRPHEGLLAAVKDYLAKRTTDMVTFDDIRRHIETGEGSNENRQRSMEVSHIMDHQLGYCPRCHRQALLLAKDAMAKSKQVEPPHQH